jgi:hypothetical protein
LIFFIIMILSNLIPDEGLVQFSNTHPAPVITPYMHLTWVQRGSRVPIIIGMLFLMHWVFLMFCDLSFPFKHYFTFTSSCNLDYCFLLRVPIEKAMETFEVNNIHIHIKLQKVYCILLRVPIEKAMETFEVNNIHIHIKLQKVYCILLRVPIEKAMEAFEVDNIHSHSYSSCKGLLHLVVCCYRKSYGSLLKLITRLNSPLLPVVHSLSFFFFPFFFTINKVNFILYIFLVFVSFLFFHNFFGFEFSKVLACALSFKFSC